LSWFADYLCAVAAQPQLVEVTVQERVFQIRLVVSFDEVRGLVQQAKKVLNEIRLGGVRAEFAELSDEAIASAVAISELIIEPSINLDQALELAKNSGLLFAELAEEVDVVGRI